MGNTNECTVIGDNNNVICPIYFKVTPARVFKGMVIDNYNLVPKIAPQLIKSAKIIEGDGGVGSIIQVFLADGDPLKYKIDTLDESRFIGKYTVMEGGNLNENAKCLSFELKVEPTTERGFLSKLKTVFTLANGAELSQKEQDGHKKKGQMICDGVEAYLLQNPNVYA